MIRALISVSRGRRSIAVMYGHREGRWYLVPCVKRVGWSYDWDNKLPGDWRTKREATEAKRALAGGRT